MYKKPKNNLTTFEKDLKAMQSILDDIESKDLSLDEVIKKYVFKHERLKYYNANLDAGHSFVN